MKAKSDFPRVIREFPDDNSGDITLPEHDGIEQKTLDELHRLQEEVKSLKQANSLLKKELKTTLEENEFLSSILNEMDAVVYINQISKDGSWEITWGNDQIEKITGYSLSEIKATGSIQHFRETYNPEHLNIISDSWNFYKAGNIGPYSGVWKKRHKNGEWIWLYTIGHLTKFNNRGQAEQSLCVGFDLTQRINLDKNLRELLNENLKIKNQEMINTLTKREKEVLKMISRGLTNREISDKLNISVHTVDSHRKALLTKLELKNSAALVRFSAESGLF